MPRRRVVSRPPLPRRAIVWFPPPEAVADLERFRAAHDPWAATLPAHVTLVFPFGSTLGTVQVAAHVRRAAGRWPALPIRFRGLGHFHADWVFLKVVRGAEAVTALHDRLYRGSLAPFLRPELPYEPHLTLGRAAHAEQCESLMERARALGLDQPREAVMRTLTLCELAADGTIAPVAEFALG